MIIRLGEIAARCPLAKSRKFRYTPPMSSASPTKGNRLDQPTIAQIAAQAGVSAPTVSKVINGRSDVSLQTRQRVEAAIREHGYERTTRPVRSAPLLEVIFHELESDWALEIIKGVEQVARENDLAVVALGDAGPRTPGPALDRRRPRAPPGGRDRGALRPQRFRTGAVALAEHPARRSRPDGRAAARHAVDRGVQLERRPRRDPASPWTGAPSHRRDRRT